jgi:hypothetical protein
VQATKGGQVLRQSQKVRLLYPAKYQLFALNFGKKCWKFMSNRIFILGILSKLALGQHF